MTEEEIGSRIGASMLAFEQMVVDSQPEREQYQLNNCTGSFVCRFA
jgi:hypothetical protein